MADRPILFSGPMVRALLAGTKTQTRRTIKLPTKREYFRPDMGGWAATTFGGAGAFLANGQQVPEQVAIWNQTTGTTIAMPIKVGDRLYVREVIAAEEIESGQDGIRYRADDAWADIENTAIAADRWSQLFHYGKATPAGMVGRNIPGMHMPRWASRLTLTVTDVRVERLHDCSEADALAEGMTQATAEAILSTDELQVYATTHILAPEARGRILYETIWDQINGDGSWASNPWVAAYTFTVERGNIDQLASKANG